MNICMTDLKKMCRYLEDAADNTPPDALPKHIDRARLMRKLATKYRRKIKKHELLIYHQTAKAEARP